MAEREAKTIEAMKKAKLPPHNIIPGGMTEEEFNVALQAQRQRIEKVRLPPYSLNPYLSLIF